MTAFRLDGLHTRPAQTWGTFRLVPLVRDEPVPWLRLHRKAYGDKPTVVDVGDGSFYTSYFIPHAFVATWQDGEAAASYGTRLLDKDTAGHAPPRVPVRMTRRMARRADRTRLRFLPLHLAVEGYLALHFGGPEIVWEEYSRRAVSRGLSPRAEEAYTGHLVQGLDDALRIFEIHDGQCGVLVYVADALASAFVVPHPDDYRALHATLVEDLFGELIYHYALLAAPAAPFPVRIDDTAVRSPADLWAQAALRRREWADFHDEVMAAGLFGQMSRYQSVQALHDFELTRFLPSFTPRRENHIGEVITDGDARVAYLKTFRLSETQTRRGYLLTRLAEYDWNLRATAAALGTDEAALALRLERAGFGYLLRQDVLDHFRAQARTPASGQRPATRRR
ncbi:ARPP-2 domain-containing protein [Actinomadura miaoliensis]|uniref:ARG and Rhodanese-Phosphatase-superfamily-associated domain-containing protein n=1 Tax=Actinomadura miaoliensis TaxID=430685 RepID=A0ABP7W4R6_9ACTN